MNVVPKEIIDRCNLDNTKDELLTVICLVGGTSKGKSTDAVLLADKIGKPTYAFLFHDDKDKERDIERFKKYNINYLFIEEQKSIKAKLKSKLKRLRYSTIIIDDYSLSGRRKKNSINEVVINEIIKSRSNGNTIILVYHYFSDISKKILESNRTVLLIKDGCNPSRKFINRLAMSTLRNIVF